MFGNKKNNLPPRPHPLLAEQILEDILNANKEDIVFRLASKGEPGGEFLHYSINTSDTESVYKRLKTYLKVKDSLTELSKTLKTEDEELRSSESEMKEMAEDIRRQAQEALIKQ